MKKGFILITSQSFDSMEQRDTHKSISHRSKVYDSRSEAEEKAKKYIGERRGDKYYICEVIACVRKVPVQAEVIEFEKLEMPSVPVSCTAVKSETL